jgi:hypothetical protein
LTRPPTREREEGVQKTIITHTQTDMHRLEKTFHYLEKTTGMILGDNLAPEKKKAHHLL